MHLPNTTAITAIAVELIDNDNTNRTHEAVLIHDGRRGARGSLGGFSLAGGDGLNSSNTRSSTAAQSRPNSGSGSGAVRNSAAGAAGSGGGDKKRSSG